MHQPGHCQYEHRKGRRQKGHRILSLEKGGFIKVSGDVDGVLVKRVRTGKYLRGHLEYWIASVMAIVRSKRIILGMCEV